MSDDLNKKIKQITDMLGQDNLPDNIKGLLSLLTSSGTKEEPSTKSSENFFTKEDRTEKSELDDNIEMIRKVKKVMDRVNNNNDPRINLLSAIKPFLNNKRQSRLNNCIKILHMSRLTGLMDENEISKSNHSG